MENMLTLATNIVKNVCGSSSKLHVIYVRLNQAEIFSTGFNIRSCLLLLIMKLRFRNWHEKYVKSLHKSGQCLRDSNLPTYFNTVFLRRYLLPQKAVHQYPPNFK